MRWVTIGSLGASVALGIGALVVAKVVMPAATHSRAQASPIISPLTNGESIVVASGDIPFGRRLQASDLKLIKVPKDAAPADAFHTVAQVLAQDHGGAPVALTPIVAKEPLLPTKLSGPGARPSVAAEISNDLRAFAIAVTEVSGVGGHALPGDRVDVVLTRDLSTDPEHKMLRSEVVIQNVRLLGVGLNADLTSDKPETAATATLEVSVEDAQKLAIAAQLGSLSLALRPSGNADIQKTAAVSGSDQMGLGLAGSGPARPRSHDGAAQPHRIIVVEGDGSGSKS